MTSDRLLLVVTIDDGDGNGDESLKSGGRESFRQRQAQRQMHLCKRGDWRRGSMAARYLTVVRGDIVLLLIMPARAGAAAYSVSGRGGDGGKQGSWRK